MKKLLNIFAMVCFALTLIACDEQTEATELQSRIIVDAYEREVSIPNNTERYICIGTGALRLYSYIADIQELVGIEEIEKTWGKAGRPYTLLLENIDDMNVIGNGGLNTSPDVERILIANPDVIFISDYYEKSVVEQLQSTTNIPCVVLTYNDAMGDIFNDRLYNSLKTIGTVTNNNDRAEEIVSYIQYVNQDLQNRTQDIEGRENVYLGGQAYKGKRGIESTSGAFKTFDLLNVNNVVYEAGITTHVLLDKEKIVEWDPNVIIIDANGYAILLDDYSTNPDFYNQLSAFENNKAFLQMPFNYYSTNLEIALANAYFIGAVVYPQAFEDINPAQKFDEISLKFLGITSYQETADSYFGGYQTISLD